jgi:hypothetical protein
MVDMNRSPYRLNPRFSAQIIVLHKHRAGLLRLVDIVEIRRMALRHELRIFAPAPRMHGSITA